MIEAELGDGFSDVARLGGVERIGLPVATLQNDRRACTYSPMIIMVAWR